MLKVSCLVSKVLHTRIHCHLCFLSLWILKNIFKTLLCLIRHESLKVAAAQSLILTKLLQSGCIDVGSWTNFFETVLHFCLSSCDGEMETSQVSRDCQEDFGTTPLSSHFEQDPEVTRCVRQVTFSKICINHRSVFCLHFSPEICILLSLITYDLYFVIFADWRSVFCLSRN